MIFSMRGGNSMPWSEKQVRLFQAAAHNPEIARKHGLSQPKARQMAAEGVKKGPMMAAKLKGK